MLSMKNIWSENIGSEKNFGPKKVLSQKNFVPRTNVALTFVSGKIAPGAYYSNLSLSAKFPFCGKLGESFCNRASLGGW